MSPRRRLVLSLLALVVAASVAACGGDDGGGTSGASGDNAAGSGATTTTSAGAPAGKGAIVVVKSMRFQPGRIQIAAGETVTWQFKDGGLQHNVVASDFTSPVKREGAYTHTFAAAGTYSYRCTLHPAMKGVVEVS